MSATTSTPTAVRFPRAEHGGILLGLSGAQLAVIAVAVVIAGASVFAAGVSGLALGSTVWGPLLAVGTVRVAGRPLTAWLPLLADWRARRTLGRATDVRSTRQPTRAEALDLPGIPRALSVSSTPELGAAVVLDRRAGTLAAVARVTSAGFLLADVAAQDHRVASWGRVLGSLSQGDDVVRLQVLHRSLPTAAANTTDAGTDVGFAERVVAELAASTRADQRETLVAVALRAGRTAGARVSLGRLAEVEKRLTTLAAALAGADLRVTEWLDPAGLRRALRASYEPDAATVAAGASSSPAGPTAAREQWDHLQTDGAVHAVYWVSEWPRAEVNPGFLQALLVTPGMRRTISLTVEPLSPAAALRQIRRAKAEHIADAAQRGRLGQVEDEATRAEQADLARRESELVAGHGDLRFTGLVTVTAASPDELGAAGTAMRSAAAQAMCEVRRLDGQHGLAHAAGALPLARRLL